MEVGGGRWIEVDAARIGQAEDGVGWMGSEIAEKRRKERKRGISLFEG